VKNKHGLLAALMLTVLALVSTGGTASAQEAKIPNDCSTIDAQPPAVNGTMVTAKAYWRCTADAGEGAMVYIRLQHETFWDWDVVESADHWRTNGNLNETFYTPTHHCAGGGWQNYRTWTFGRIGADPTVHRVSAPVRVWCG
jgi:hypothetical protein